MEEYTNGPIKVLFLDFDGVINTYRGYRVAEGSLDLRITRFLHKIEFSKIVKYIAKLLGEKSKIRRWVIHHWRNVLWKQLSRDEGFDPMAFHWLNMLLENHPDLHIVISSIWRGDGLWHLRRLLALHGISPGRVISSTPNVDSYRGKEIKAWLEGFERNPNLKPYWYIEDRDAIPRNTPHNLHVNVVNFAIVDDDSDMEPFLEHFVQTDGHDGITHRDYVKLHRILSKEVKK